MLMHGLWLQSLMLPMAVFLQGIQNAVVQARTAPLPEFHGIRYQPIAAPMFRAWRMVAVLFFRLHISGFQRFAIGDGLALGRRNRTEPAFQRTAVEIGVAVGGGHTFDPTFDAHLALQRYPVEQKGPVLVLPTISGPSGVVVFVKHEKA